MPHDFFWRCYNDGCKSEGEGGQRRWGDRYDTSENETFRTAALRMPQRFTSSPHHPLPPSYSPPITPSPHRFLVPSVALCLLVTCGQLLAQDIDVARAQANREAVQAVAPSLVRIETAGGVERVGDVLTGVGPTTGLVISPDGWIVSSAFAFAKKPAGILVETTDGQKHPARLVATDRSRMISLLKIEATDLPIPVRVPKSEIQPGQIALALGRTWGGGSPSMATGIISAVGRVWGRAIQTDAKVSPLNYGGPLIDLEGRVYGILVPLDPSGASPTAGFQWYDSGIGFAIALEDILLSLPLLQEGDRFPGLAGITMKGNQPFQPPVIERVWWRSPAAEAGMQAGDVIVRADDSAVTRFSEFMHVIGNKYAGEPIAIVVRRGKEEVPVSLQLAAELPKYTWPLLGFFGDKADNGVRVSSVIPETPANKGGLQEGDVVVNVDEKDVRSPADIRAIVDQKSPGESVTLSVVRGAETTSVPMEVAGFPTASPALTDWNQNPKPDEKLALTQQRLGNVRAKVYSPALVTEALRPGLILYLEGGKAPNSDVVASAWTSVCQRHGLVIVSMAPTEEEWSPQDMARAGKVLTAAIKDLKIDPDRVIIHGVGSTAVAAHSLTNAHRKLVRGLVLLGAAPGSLGMTDPSEKLAVAWLADVKEIRRAQIDASRRALFEAGYPVFSNEVKLTEQGYLPERSIEQLGLWSRLLGAL